MTLLFLTTGCGSIKDILSDTIKNASDAIEEYSEKNKHQSPHEYAVSTFNEVLDLVQAKDSQALFNMFSEYNRNNVDLMPDIKKLVNFLDGNVVEMRRVGASSDYSSVRDGVTISAGYSATTYVTTEQRTVYWFKVGVVTDADDETKLGLDWIYILNSTLQEIHTDAWAEWWTNHFDDKEAEPKRPDNIEVGVNYFKSQKSK